MFSSKAADRPHCQGFLKGKNSFQIRNSLKWKVAKERPLGEALIQMPMASTIYEATTHVK